MAGIIEIVVSAIDKASGDIKDITKSVDGLKDATEDGAKGSANLSGGIASMAATAGAALGVITAFGAAVVQGFKFAEQGAALDTARQKFDLLAESVGATGDALLIDLQRATSGLVSDSELIASAGDLMSLGLANTSDEAVRLSRVAGALDMEMNALTLTLTNKTTARFDTLNVAVAGFDERMKELIDTGLDADAAFQEAFLQQAEEQINKVGDAADSASAPFMRLRAEIENTADSAKKQLVPVFGDLITTFLDAKDAQDEYNSIIDNSNVALRMHIGELAMAKYGTDDFAARLLILRENFADIDEATSSYDKSLMNYVATTQTAVQANDGMTISTGEYLKMVSDAGRELDSFTRSEEKLREEFEQGKITLDEMNAALEENAETFQESTNKRILARAQELLAADGLTVAEEGYLLRMGLSMGVYTEEYVAQAQQIIDESQKIVNEFNRLPTEKTMTLNLRVRSQLNQIGISGGGLSQMPGFADGGSVSANKPIIVGERGPEVFMPSGNGTIIPNHAMGGNVNVTLVYSPAVSIGSREEAENVLLPMIENGIREAQRNQLL